MNQENMQLWQSVYKTDPSAVKPITGKSYSGNSPKPFWLIERATRIFGAAGIGWGVEVVKESYQQVSPDDWLHSAVVRFWYIYDGKRGQVEQMGGTKAAYKTSSGKILVDEDAAKKSVTDGMVKCMSMLGFAGDIFSGRWDDNKYIQEVRAHFEAEKANDAAQTITIAQCDELHRLILQKGGTVETYLIAVKLNALIDMPAAQFEVRKQQLIIKQDKVQGAVA